MTGQKSIEPQIREFGETNAGQQVHSIDLARGGLSASVLTYGAALQDLRLAAHAHPLVLGWTHLQGYERSACYLGVLAGRVANRIAGGTYQLGGQTFHTDRNFLGKHTLHGGRDGMDRQVWEIVDCAGDAVTLGLSLPDGHMGFEGDLDTTATFRIEPDATLSIEIKAQTKTRSLCNVTPHIYFNLDGSGDISQHSLTVHADHYTPVDDEGIPTGEVSAVADTPMGLRSPRLLGRQGFDHNYCVSDRREDCREIAVLTGAKSGISMHLATTEPGLQVYSGAYLDEDGECHTGTSYRPFDGVALEPQVWPDAPNHPNFPSAVLHKGEVYHHISRYSFRLGN